MTDQELLEQQDRLQKIASELVDELGLAEKLGQLGTFHLVGSATLGLMVWPDIDMEVHVDDYQLSDMLSVAEHLLSQKSVVDVTLRDYRQDPNPNKPKGLYIGGKAEKDDVRWKLDIWLVRSQDKQSGDITKQMLSIAEDQKLAILRIKNAVWDNDQYRKKIISMDIYDAVMNFEIRDLDGFSAYLAKTGRSL